jgi:hypothetical protein
MADSDASPSSDDSRDTAAIAAAIATAVAAVIRAQRARRRHRRGAALVPPRGTDDDGRDSDATAETAVAASPPLAPPPLDWKEAERGRIVTALAAAAPAHPHPPVDLLRSLTVTNAASPASRIPVATDLLEFEVETTGCHEFILKFRESHDGRAWCGLIPFQRTWRSVITDANASAPTVSAAAVDAAAGDFVLRQDLGSGSVARGPHACGLSHGRGQTMGPNGKCGCWMLLERPGPTPPSKAQVAFFEAYVTETHNVSAATRNTRTLPRECATEAESERLWQSVEEARRDHLFRLKLPVPPPKPPPEPSYRGEGGALGSGALTFPDLPDGILTALRVGQEVVFVTPLQPHASGGGRKNAVTTRIRVTRAVPAAPIPLEK